MFVKATEIASATISSDNPIHQRLLYAYEQAEPYIKGDVLELGCGEGRGLELILAKADSYTAFEKNPIVIDGLKKKYKDINIIERFVPPFTGIEDNSIDTICTFQVIEHIEDDVQFVEEIHRVLKPGGRAIISTPNIDMSLTRNPWHIREYKPAELTALMAKYFSEVKSLGVYGSDAVNEYYERNKASVAKYKKLDIFNLEQKLPRSILEIPYNILNRLNRHQLQKSDDKLVTGMTTADFRLEEANEFCYDLFYVVTK